jgi:ATP-dependent exoDNAse (exonuclease V) beta subunit
MTATTKDAGATKDAGGGDASPARLADAAARHTIEYRLDSTLFVEAGAGSGKTTALVARIVQLLRSGACSLDSLAAITFTEAAALELKFRVRESLTALAEHGRHGPERERVHAALDHIDEAAISTIHGFCQRLLAEHPIEAGLPPRIEILDEVRQSLAWRDHWSLLLDRLGEDDGMRRLFGAASLIGVAPPHLETLARHLSEEWNRCGRAGADTAAVMLGVRGAVERASVVVESSIGRALQLASQCTDEDDRLLARLRVASDFRDDLRAAGAGTRASADVVEDRLGLLAASEPYLKAGASGQRASWACDVDEVRASLDEAQAARDACAAEVCDVVLRGLVATFDVAARDLAERRRTEGKLVFHDLLVLARDLLLERPAVLADVHRRIRFLLIDEFQDTDPLQLEIAELIGSGRAVGGAPGPPEPGRLFFVGDPKQSIYRFRGADLPAYTSARQRLAPSGPISLTSNFRSVPLILEFANECFPSLMGVGYSALRAVRTPDTAGPSVRIVGGVLEAGMRRHDQRVAESEGCATVIERAVRTELWSVGDRRGGFRPARMSDVAVLVPRRTGLAELEAALDARGIGYRVESASLIYRSQEVRDLLALCKAIDDPSDQVALLAALRSPAFACGDDELYAFRAGGGAWSIERLRRVPADGATVGDAPAPVEPLVIADPSMPAAGKGVLHALALLRGYRDRRFELGPVGVLELAVRDRRLLQLAAGSPRGRESWRRVRFLIERARAFVEAGGGGLREFAVWVDEQLSEGLRSVESVLPEPDEDVVHILTVHAAKGLEFPITVLAGFGTTDEARRLPGPRVLRTATGAAEVHVVRKLDTAGFAGLKAAEAQLEHDEAVRVLYVAVTRARDHLVVCGHHVQATGEVVTLGQRLYEAAQAALERRPGLWEAVDPVDVSRPATPLLQRSIDDDRAAPRQGSLFDMAAMTADDVVTRVVRPLGASVEDWQAWHRERGRLLARIARRRSVRATEVALLAGPQLAPSSDDVTVMPDPVIPAGRPRARTREATDGSHDASIFATDGEMIARRRRGRGGTQLGRAVHATLQAIDLATARSLAAGGPGCHELTVLARAHASAERIGHRAGDVEHLVLAALSSPTVRAAFATGTPHREVYVATTIGGVVLDGYVDLCFEDAGELTVVDYKTDSVRDGAEVEASVEHHCLQAAAYGLALGDATGLVVRRCVLIFLSPPGQPIELEVPDLADTMARVRGLVGAAS